MWDTVEPLATITKAKIFSPKIRQTPFKTDTVKFTISGSLHLIDGIGKLLFLYEIFSFNSIVYGFNIKQEKKTNFSIFFDDLV